MLSRRDYSHMELSRKLADKGFQSGDINEIITELAHKGMLCEQRFAENYIYWRKGRGYGPLRIQQELQARGIGAEIIAQFLNITDNAWLDDVRTVWQKHFKNKKPADYSERARQMRFLQYRGFTREQIESIFENI